MAWGWVHGNSDTSERRYGRPTTRFTAPPQFLARTRDLLAEPTPQPPAELPFVLGNRRHRHSMNSWLNELPGLHPRGKGSEVVMHPLDAAALGISDGDHVRVHSHVGAVELSATLSDRPRRGVVLIDHGWGSRVFDPTGPSKPEVHGVNKNVLVEGDSVDPLSQTATLGGAFVGVERLDRSS